MGDERDRKTGKERGERDRKNVTAEQREIDH